MTPIDFNTCSAVDVINRSMACHPSLFLDSLKSRAKEDLAYMAIRQDALTVRAVQASIDATKRAISYAENDGAIAFNGDMSAGIIALNIACKLQCVSPALRTDIAVRTWESDKA